VPLGVTDDKFLKFLAYRLVGGRQFGDLQRVEFDATVLPIASFITGSRAELSRRDAALSA
jgi:hypothetical protein